ncbi:uroporphyrinogen-III synthase [Paenibacillus caui]|uniref:uroporphyrinogen-III synthase n=1 Tax=Paenibacillus caui TaxID=2873927 RepID=UPI001CA87CC0|nr:uroporphyrinogen-III synthase [Paenibacillus caui]
MGGRLEGKRIALTGPRRSQELSKLVENMGGIPLLRPSQGTVFLDDTRLRDGIVSWLSKRPEWAVLTTGMGLEALFGMAEDMGLAADLWDLLRDSRIAARGYKTVNALKKRKLEPVVRDDDGSSEGLIHSWESLGLADSLQGASVMLQLHGDPAPRLNSWLEEKGASVIQLLPYRHVSPPEESLEQLLKDILGGAVDAVTFTSSPQVRFLLEYAAKSGRSGQLLEALEGPVVAVSVGKVTAQGLREAGLTRVIAPREERMGSMMVELARYYAGQNGKE